MFALLVIINPHCWVSLCAHNAKKKEDGPNDDESHDR
jgi:hypothetical protein